MTFSLKKFALAVAFGVAYLSTLSCGEHGWEDIFGLDSSSSEEEEELPSSSSSLLGTSNGSGLQQSSSSSQLGTSSSSSWQQSSDSGILTDSRDNKTYKTVKIGDQVWIAENLNIETGNSVCYNNDPANCQKYGRLYDWETAMNACPNGWHLPSNYEWEKLLRYVDGTSGTASPYISETAGKYLKDNGTNNFGFSALLGGGYCAYAGSNVNIFIYLGSLGTWWTSTERTNANAYSRHMSSNDDGGSYTSDNKSYLHSVRCIKGDGNSHSIENYKIKQIGTQTWMAENLNIETSNSKCYNNDPANCAIYGRLYDWVTAMNLPSNCNSTACAGQISAKHRGICPEGWHIPSDADWNVLMKFVNPSCKDDSHCPDAGTKLKATNGWNDNTNGTDDFGFAALPGGAWSMTRASGFYGAGDYGNWWTAREVSGKSAYSRSMGWSYEYVGRLDGGPDGDRNLKEWAYSVRCIKD